MLWINEGTPPDTRKRPLPRDEEVERLVEAINRGGKLMIDAEGKPYVA
jgi:hypothetical protein